LEATRLSLLGATETRTLLYAREDGLLDPLLSRRVDLLLRRSRWLEIEAHPQVYRLRNRIDQAILSFKPPIGAVRVSRVQRFELLRSDPDRSRRHEAFLAMGPLAEQIEADVRELLVLRQALARQQGYDGYVSWALETSGLDRRWVAEFFRRIRRKTDAPYRAWLKNAGRRLSLEKGMRPWDLAYAADEVPSPRSQARLPVGGSLAAVRKVAEGLGLDEAAAGVRVDFADIPYGALCYAVRPPDDVRILIGPRDGRVHHDVLFHEFGHALHWRSIGPLPPALRWESAAFNESMACLWERLAYESGESVENVNGHRKSLTTYDQDWAERAIFRLRLRIAQATFEYRAYQAPHDDLLALYRDIHSEHLGVSYDEVSAWSDNPFWTSHPMYLQNYVIGEAVASHTLAELRRRFGRVIHSPEAGAWLVAQYYAPGASLPWPQKVSRATGGPLRCDPLLSDLGCA
jgi:oligoendopeptidase F